MNKNWDLKFLSPPFLKISLISLCSTQHQYSQHLRVAVFLNHTQFCAVQDWEIS